MAGHVGALLAGAEILQRGVNPANAIGLAAWGYLVYLQIRVSLDAELFTWLANGGTAQEIDGFLVTAGLIPAAKERSPAGRCQGAIGLWRRLLIVLVVELVAVAIGLRW